MKLLTLELENWACHNSLNIDLSQGLQIEGRNGTGKSSILEAIRFVFAKSGTGFKHRLKNSADNARVTLTFSRDSTTYKIEKTLSRDKSSTAVMFMNGEQIADNPSSVSQLLDGILREDLLEKLLYVPQGELVGLVDRLSSKHGRQELDFMFGLDRFEKVWKGVGEEIQACKAKLEILEGQRSRYPENAEELYSTRIKNLSDESSALAKKIDELDKKTKSFRERLSALDVGIDSILKIKGRKDFNTERVEHLRMRILKLENDLKNTLEKLDGVEKKKKELEALKETEAGLKKFPRIRELLLELESIRKRMQEFDELDNYKRKLVALRSELMWKTETEKTCSELEAKVLELETNVATNRRVLDERQKSLADLETLSKEPKCPRCGQVLTWQHLWREKNQLKSDIDTVGRAIEQSGAMLKNLKANLNEKKSVLRELERKEIEVEHLVELIQKQTSKQEGLHKTLRDTELRLKHEGYVNEQLIVVEDHAREFSTVQARIHLLSQDIEKERRYFEEKLSLANNLQEIKAEKLRLEEELKTLHYDESKLEELRIGRETAQKEFYLSNSDLEKNKILLENNRKALDETENEKKEFLNSKRQLDEAKKQLSLLMVARDFFHTDKGIVKYLRERYIHQLGNLLSYYFNSINQNPNYRDVEFDENYGIQIKTNSGVLSIAQLSGGEKAQISIALRIAIIEMLSPVRLLILDEPFGSLDREHRDLLGDSLNKVAENGQVILVTHIPVDSLQLSNKLHLGGYQWTQ